MVGKTMELSEYRRCITAPIVGDSPVGERLLDDSLYEFVEDQMMKVGSLSYDSVQWDEVEHSVLKLLSEKTKDLKLVVYLLQCLHNQVTPARFNMSLFVLGDFMTHYWESAFPAPGPRGNLPRRKFLSQMMQRFSGALEKQDVNRFSEALRSDLKAALEQFDTIVTTLELASDGTTAVINSIKVLLRKSEERQKLEQDTPKSASDAGRSVTTTSTTTTSAASLSVDNSSDKAAKQTLLKVADFLAEDDYGSALSIRVRRHAIWGVITSVPDHNNEGETLLRPMQQDRIKDYEDMMRSPDLALWRKVEQSLTMAPYWFDGQLMSYKIAEALDKPTWCKAIREEAQQFLNRLSSLANLKFKGGAPFVSPAVSEWLQEHSSGAGHAVSAGDWEQKRSDASQLAKEAGLAVALSMLNEGLNNASEPRDKFYWRMLSAQLLEEHRLEAMALEQYRTLYNQATAMAVTDWEPSLIQQLEKQITSE
jgi:type VI secretion system protein VasJ